MNEQQLLLTLIWNDNPTLLAESGYDIAGIAIYRRNLLANAQRSLSITFPTIFKLLDSDISESLVQEFLTLCPPDQGDWAQWGETFADFIATHQIAHNYPYLPDCALLDWHFHCALQGPDQTLVNASLALLANTEPENISVIFNENLTLMQTMFPIDDIFQAHHHPEQSIREDAMRNAKIALSAKCKPRTVMLFRRQYQPKVTRLTDSDADFMYCLKAGKPLADALDAVGHCNDFSFEKWLLTAIEQNWILHLQDKT